MTQGAVVTADGKASRLHYFTGKVLATQKQKETQVSSQQMGTQGNPIVSVTSTTVDHHEFFLVDAEGVERNFKMTDFDFPCREGQTVSVVWVIPEGSAEGPYIAARNHNTNDRVVIDPKRIAYAYAKPAWMSWVGAGASLVIIGVVVNWILGMISVLAPFFYFRWLSRKAAKAVLDSAELSALDQQLSSIRPLPA